MHDEKINKDTEKEIVDFLKKSDLYNYKEPEEVTKANEEAEKRVEEFRSGKIETLSEKYRQCNNVKKLVVKEEITNIKEFINRDLIGANFLISCNDKQEQPKFFIFEKKKENNQKNDDKKEENNIEIEIVNDKKIKVTKGDERALDLKKQKYALFKITTNNNNTVYLYCSDVESSGNGEDVYGIFENTNHKSISVFACDTEKITNMGRMFSECSNLKDLEFGKIFDTSNVTNMSFMFSYCEQIKNLDISNFNVKKVNNICSMFRYCKNLETLNFKHFEDLDKNTFCENLFYNCQNLEKIDMDDFDRLNSFAEKEDNKIFQECKYLNNELNNKKEQNKNIDIVSI